MEEDSESTTELTVYCSGFSESDANQVGQDLLEIISFFRGRLPPCELDAITVAYDYEEALAGIDRGSIGTTVAPKPTQNEFGAGVAMALPVERSGRLVTHLVFGPVIVALLNQARDDEEKMALALSIISHELGHAVDHTRVAEAFGLLSANEAFSNPEDFYLWSLSHVLWDEYHANRVSASIVQRGNRDRELYLSAKVSFRAKVEHARCKYHVGDIDLDEYLIRLSNETQFLLRCLGYLLGAIDADETKDVDIASLLTAEGLPNMDALVLAVRSMWDARDEISKPKDLLRMNLPMRQFLAELRLGLRVVGDNLAIDVPVDLRQVLEFQSRDEEE